MIFDDGDGWGLAEEDTGEGCAAFLEVEEAEGLDGEEFLREEKESGFGEEV